MAYEHEVGQLLERLHLQKYLSAFEAEDITERWVLRSMGAQLLSNLADLGLDARAASTVAEAVLPAKDVTSAERFQWAVASADYGQRNGVRCLRILNQPVMEDWEAPYMQALARIACSRTGRVLEVGYGLGMSARFIDEYASGAWVTEHVIIEANAEVAAAARRFAETARVQTTVLEGFWQEAVLTLQPGSFAGVLFDTFPLRGSGQ
eukprot:6081355-Prymnesium_polylepis.1